MTSMPLVPYRLTICGLSELCRHAEAGVSHVLTILDPEWPDPGDFERYPPHRRTVWRFHDTITADTAYTYPEPEHVRAILDFGEAVADDIDHLLVHCHMGVSRSTAAAAILLAQRNPGREREAFDLIRDIRPRSWPNSRMIAFADEMLGRGGALLSAMREHHRAVARAHPDFVAYLIGTEREVEVNNCR